MPLPSWPSAVTRTATFRPRGEAASPTATSSSSPPSTTASAGGGRGTAGAARADAAARGGGGSSVSTAIATTRPASRRELGAEADARDPVPVRPGDGEHGDEHAGLHEQRLPVRRVHDRRERGERRDRAGNRRRAQYEDRADRDRGEAPARPCAPARDEQDEPADPDRRRGHMDEVRKRDQRAVVPGVECVAGQRRRGELERCSHGGDERPSRGPQARRARPQRRQGRRSRRSRSRGRTGSRRRPARSPAVPARRPRSGSGRCRRPRSPADADRARAGRAP